jgi:UDP-2,4-diacetamido-2,4,6-trideoxy-beta-L-altropyranose hydrolase
MIFLFRVDATPAMGTGHAMRCLALAEGLHDRGQSSHFLVAATTAAVERRLAAEGVAVSCIAPADDATGEVTCRIAAAIGAAAVIVDGYHFSAAWREGVRRGGPKVLSFHDHAGEGALSADIVINAAAEPGDPALRRLAPAAQWLLGGEYVLLRRELRQAMTEPLPPLAERGAILVTFGGSDPLALTLPVAQALCRAPGIAAPLDIVIGGSVADAGSLVAALDALGPGLRLHRDPPRLGALMRQAGLAISAAGGTMSELAALGVPSLVTIVADNQEPGARRAAAMGWAQALDGRPPDAASAIAAAARGLWSDAARREAMLRRARGVVDGKGVARVCDVLLSCLSREA